MNVSSSRTPLATFLMRLPVTLLIAMLIWLPLRPILDRTTTKFAQTLIRVGERPNATRLLVAEHNALVHRNDARPGSGTPVIALTGIHFNTIVLLALSFALPTTPLRRRLVRLAVAWSLLLSTQAFNLVFHVKYLYASAIGVWSLRNYSELSRNVYGFLQFFTDLPGRFAFPFLLWLVFNWDDVMALIGHVGDQGANGRK